MKSNNLKVVPYRSGGQKNLCHIFSVPKRGELPYNQTMQKSVAIIGGGPAGLMAAEVISTRARSIRVDLYDSMPSLGRKFLIAGKGGLNITHSEPFQQFVSRYGKRSARIEPMLKRFGPDELRQWAHGLGIETFVGTSGRVFPVGMKASPLLRAWLKRLSDSGMTFHLRHKWTGSISSESSGLSINCETPEGAKKVKADAVLLALGGGSWSRLGSDGAWVPWLRDFGAEVEPLRPSNCGFEVAWSPHFRDRFEGHPMKSVVLSFGSFHQQGEFPVCPKIIHAGLLQRVGVQSSPKLDQCNLL